MIPWRPAIAAVGLLLAGGVAGANAATTATFAPNATVSLDGFTGTITSLSCSSCTSGDQLQVFEVAKNVIEFEVVNSNSASSILSATGSQATTLSFTLQ